MNNKFKNKKGFTVLEMVVAVAVFTVVMTMSMQTILNINDFYLDIERLVNSGRLTPGQLSILKAASYHSGRINKTGIVYYEYGNGEAGRLVPEVASGPIFIYKHAAGRAVDPKLADKIFSSLVSIIYLYKRTPTQKLVSNDSWRSSTRMHWDNELFG